MEGVLRSIPWAMSKTQYYSICFISDLDDGVVRKLLNSDILKLEFKKA